jgi:uncharacterized protein DUF3551
MRWTLVTLLLVAPALLGRIQPATAQAAVAAYPWCLERYVGGPRICYYSTYEQCVYDARPEGGVCIQSPYYRGPAASFGGPEVPRYSRPNVHYRAKRRNPR